MVSKQNQGSGHISAVLVSTGLIKALQILIISHFSSPPVITHLNHPWDTGPGDVLGWPEWAHSRSHPAFLCLSTLQELTFPQQLEKTAVGPDYLLSLELGFRAWIPGLVWRHPLLSKHSNEKAKAEGGERLGRGWGQHLWELNPIPREKTGKPKGPV